MANIKNLIFLGGIYKSVDSWIQKVVVAAINSSITNFPDGQIDAIDTSFPLGLAQAAYINF
jgi:hypothetical protein